MAGIYDEWLNKVTGEIVNTFSIITTEANALTDYIHNTKHRMPAILSLENEEKWLNPALDLISNNYCSLSLPIGWMHTL